MSAEVRGPVLLNTNSLAAGGKIGVAGTSITNLRHGVFGAMTAGTIVITDAGATANTRYFIGCGILGTVIVPSAFNVSARSVGVSFTIVASQNTDTSSGWWFAIEP